MSSDYLKPIEHDLYAIYYGKTSENNIKSILSLDEILKILKRNM